jgi:SAM-dependent methyltransferase
MAINPDTKWTDDEIVMTKMTPDTDFVFERMTAATIAAVAPAVGEPVLDVACGRAIDALSLRRLGARMTGIEASDVMIEKALEYLGVHRAEVVMVRALAEALPFADHSFAKVVCKGAMDHFADIDRSMAEITRVTRPDGRVIIAIANYESLTSRAGRAIWTARSRIFHTPLPDKPFWDPPDDHNFKFDLPTLTRLMTPHCELESILGLSLLWGFPKWGAVLQRLPARIVAPILIGLDAGARAFPGLADVIVAVGKPRP